jgi:heptosyltransferase-2
MTPPLAADAKIVYSGLSCSPCFERECPLGHLNCLRGISVEEVLRQLPQ